MKIVEVTWIDTISGRFPWRSRDELDQWIGDEGAIQKSSGYLYKNTDDYVVLVDAYQDSEDGNVGRPIQIPAVCVQDIRDVKTGRKIK